MPKESVEEIAERWKQLDRQLMSPDGVDLREFAADWDRSPRTIERDIEVFGTLGYPVERIRPGVYRYKDRGHGSPCIFAANLAAVHEAIDATAKLTLPRTGRVRLAPRARGIMQMFASWNDCLSLARLLKRIREKVGDGQWG